MSQVRAVRYIRSAARVGCSVLAKCHSSMTVVYLRFSWNVRTPAVSLLVLSAAERIKWVSQNVYANLRTSLVRQPDHLLRNVSQDNTTNSMTAVHHCWPEPGKIRYTAPFTYLVTVWYRQELFCFTACCCFKYLVSPSAQLNCAYLLMCVCVCMYVCLYSH